MLSSLRGVPFAAAVVFPALAIGGCGEAGDRGGAPTTGAVPLTSAGTEATSAADDTDSSGDNGDNTDGGPTADDGDPSGPDDPLRLDVAAGEETAGADDGANQEGCQKVDFLFVIDSSRSMEDEQTNLLTSFPGFIAAIEQVLDFDDFHLMVIDAGVVPGGGCDGTLGAGRTTSGAGIDCGLEGGLRYATQDQTNLLPTFGCMANRGIAGSGDEQTMDSLTAALGPLAAMGQCNQGFLRDDAILVVTIITDEEDSPADINLNPALDGSCVPVDSDPNSLGDPVTWQNAVVAAKNGDAAAAVVLALVGDCDSGGTCAGISGDPNDPFAPVSGAEPAPRLRAFASSFEFGSIGPVCAPDYSPFFEAAVGVIESACDDFEPPA